MKYIVNNIKIRIIAHILYILIGTLYILAGQLSIEQLRKMLLQMELRMI